MKKPATNKEHDAYSISPRIPADWTEEQALEAALSEAEAAGVTPSAVMVSLPDGAVTGEGDHVTLKLPGGPNGQPVETKVDKPKETTETKTETNDSAVEEAAQDEVDVKKDEAVANDYSSIQKSNPST